jgi:DNA-binding transcriptional MocR family regulator
LDTFRTLGARLHAFSPGFADGTLQQAIGSGAFRALYCIPTFHNPTGHVMPEHARRNLAVLAREHDVPILEDCALDALTFSGPPPKPVAYYDPENVISAGSLSKLFWPGMRVGWIRASKSTIARLGRLKVMSDLGTPVPSQILALRVLGAIERIAEFRQLQLRSHCELLCQCLADQLSEWTFTKPAGGLCLWVRLPLGDATTFAPFAARAGVRILPGSSMTVDGSCSEYLRLPFTISPEIIEASVKRLASAWSRYTHVSRRGDTLRVVV